MSSDLSRRAFLLRSGFVGCSLAASPLVTPLSFAAAPGENRLVVIILRGGMDALDVVQPYGDPAYADLRKVLAGGPETGAEDLDGFYSLHPALAPLMPMWRAGELGFVQAVSTPYRDKRSHFDGQDILEAGTADLAQGTRDGWLNRMLQTVPGVTGRTAYAIGQETLKVLEGPAPVANWVPETELPLSPQAQRLMELITESDPEMHAALAEAQVLAFGTGDGMADLRSIRDAARANQGGAHKAVAAFAAKKLSDEARIASFSLNGWDTHRGQPAALGRALTWLSDTLLILKSEMPKDVWGKTAVVAMTEFGRTARENGTRGTDHGTGGLMVTAGGAIRGGRVFGDWPGLAESDLYQGRDLLPTRDVRAHAAWIMRGLYGIDHGTLEGSIFPGLDLGRDPGLLL